MLELYNNIIKPSKKQSRIRVNIGKEKIGISWKPITIALFEISLFRSSVEIKVGRSVCNVIAVMRLIIFINKFRWYHDICDIFVLWMNISYFILQELIVKIHVGATSSCPHTIKLRKEGFYEREDFRH